MEIETQKFLENMLLLNTYYFIRSEKEKENTFISMCKMEKKSGK